jgi:sugar lactone lactonase YvrE
MVLSLAVVSCSSAQPTAVSPQTAVEPALTAPANTAIHATVAVAAPGEPPLPPPVIVKEAGLKVPESVLYDAEQDVYFVSNIEGQPTDADRNGFISKLGPDGKVIELKFIDGSKGSFLSAPKGMAIQGETLYVADITFVRRFDRKTGASKGKFGAPGATFLNDISVAPDGTLYVTDTGWKAAANGLENSGSDAIYVIGPTSGTAKVLVRDTKLGNPNGIVADNDGAWVASGAGTLYRVSKTGEITQEQKLPDRALDGLVVLTDGSLLVTSWASKTVYRGKPGGAFEPLVTAVESPADIGFDTKRNQLLLPLFTKDQVQFHVVSGLAASSAQVAAAPAPVPTTTVTAPVAKTQTAPAPASPASVAKAPAAPAPKAPAAPAADVKTAEAPTPAAAPKVATPAAKPKADLPASHVAPAKSPAVPAK